MAKTAPILFDQVDNSELYKVLRIMRGITHPLRLRILSFIDRNKSATVNKIHSSLEIEQSIASQQLNILRSAGLVNTRREGKYIYYSVNYPVIQHIVAQIEKNHLK